MTKLANKTGLLGLISGCFLAACAQQTPMDTADQGEASTERADVSTKLAPRIATIKPGASVTFSHDAVKPLQVGESGAVVLTVNEGYPSGTLVLEAMGEEGLAIFGAGKTLRVDMGGVTTHSWRMDFEAEADGVHYINILATAEPKGGLTETRAYAVRVEVGDWHGAQSKAASEKPMEMLETGEAAIMLKADETIE
ncbi:MAG: hypothetical protein ABJH52_02495 [Henriciella sp.]